MSDIKSCPVGAKLVSPSCHLGEKIDKGCGLLKHGCYLAYWALFLKTRLNWVMAWSTKPLTVIWNVRSEYVLRKKYLFRMKSSSYEIYLLMHTYGNSLKTQAYNDRSKITVLFFLFFLSVNPGTPEIVKKRIFYLYAAESVMISFALRCFFQAWRKAKMNWMSDKENS